MAFDSLFVGVSGLNAYQNQIDLISNNIANVGTTGYKGQRMTFQDLLYQNQSFASAPTNTSGGINGQQLGLGVKTGSIDTLFAQGGLQTTGVNTDLAINGDGFFVLRAPNANGSPVYTRDGAFSLNANGLLYDPSSGLAVQGYSANSQGIINGTGVPGDVTIPLGLRSQAVGTGLNPNLKFGPTSADQVFDAQIGGNLDQSQWTKEAQGVQAGTVGTGQASTTTTTIYDSLGNAHLATITYTPDATGATPAAAGPPPVAASNGLPTQVADSTGNLHAVASRWKVSVSFQDGTTFDTIDPVTGAPAGAAASGVVGFAYFDQSGQYVNSSNQLGSGAVLSGAAVHAVGQAATSANGNQLDIRSWGSNGTNNAVAPTAPGAAPAPGPIGLDYSQQTSLAGTADLRVLYQNGFTAGTLSNITIGQDGTIQGAFTNGQTTALGRVATATFQNEQGLQRLGGSQFAATSNSGLAQYGTAGSGKNGAIVSGALEQSNVSIADEFTKMILAQRSFEANSKSITTADEDLQTVVNLKR